MTGVEIYSIIGQTAISSILSYVLLRAMGTDKPNIPVIVTLSLIINLMLT